MIVTPASAAPPMTPSELIIVLSRRLTREDQALEDFAEYEASRDPSYPEDDTPEEDLHPSRMPR